MAKNPNWGGPRPRTDLIRKREQQAAQPDGAVPQPDGAVAEAPPRRRTPPPPGQARRKDPSRPDRPQPKREPIPGQPFLSREVPAKPVAATPDVSPMPAQPRRPLLMDGPTALALMEQIKDMMPGSRTPARNPFRLPEFPPGAIPKKKSQQMAMDSATSWASTQWESGAWAQGVFSSLGAEGLLFLGYPYLSELAQRPEYRVISETIADDATRKWIDFEVTGKENEESGADKEKKRDAERQQAIDESRPTFKDPDPDVRKDKIEKSGKTDKVKALKDELDRLEVRDRFYAIIRDDGFFGRSHLYLNFGEESTDPKGEQELKTPIGNGRDKLSRGKVSKQRPLKKIRVIEPVWVYPIAYNAQNPLADDWYNPQTWYVMGREIHTSRLLPFITRPVPDLLKPAYSFGGLSLSQMAKPYVDIWLTTRQAVADLIRAFSIMCLSTDMQTNAAPGGTAGLGNVAARAALFNMYRDNMGLFLLNKDTEEFSNVSAPLGSLDHLQAQAQEHMASVSRIPLVKLTGISPSGLNASSEGEIRVYYDTIAAFQNRALRKHLTQIIDFVQLSLWGEIDQEINFEFEPLWDMTAKELADLQKAEVERDEKLVDMGAFAPAEIRKIKINDPKLPFTGLDPADLPELLEEEESGFIPEGAGRGLEAVLDEPGAEPGGGKANGGSPSSGQHLKAKQEQWKSAAKNKKMA